MSKKETPISGLFGLLTRVPFWVGPVLALLVFLILRYLVPSVFYRENPDSPMQSSMNKTLAGFARAIAPILAGVVLALWLGAEAKKFLDRHLLDKTEGIGDIRNMTWREFESLVGEAYRRQGYDVQETGSASGDGGIDLILERGGERVAVQCKQWLNRQVGVKVVRELYGSMADAGAMRGIIVCCGAFSPDAEAFAQRNGIELVTGRDLERLIAEAKSGKATRPTGGRARSASAVALAAKPSAPSVPTCPVCGSEMHLVTARTKFWGCSQYPQCLGTRQLERPA